MLLLASRQTPEHQDNNPGGTNETSKAKERSELSEILISEEGKEQMREGNERNEVKQKSEGREPRESMDQDYTGTPGHLVFPLFVSTNIFFAGFV